MSKTAVILSGGVGTRLRPYTAVLPKPLMPIGDYPILEVLVRQLASADVKRIILAVNHQAEIIRSYFNGGDKWNVSIEYSLEKEPLGTMGPLKLLENDLPEKFLVLNGDVLTDLDFSHFYDSHIRRDSLFTIASYKRSIRSEFGVLKIDGSNTLVGFEEKPVSEYLVSMGVYMVSKASLDYIEAGTLFGFDNLMHTLLAAGKRVESYCHDGLWLDIGRPDDYLDAIDLFEQNKARFLGPGVR